MAGVARPRTANVLVRIQSSGPHAGTSSPPRWAHGEKASPLPCKQQFSVRVRVGPPNGAVDQWKVRRLSIGRCEFNPRQRYQSVRVNPHFQFDCGQPGCSGRPITDTQRVRDPRPPPIRAEFVQRKGRGPTNRRRGFDSFTPHQLSGDRRRTASRGVVAPVKRVRLPPITPGT